MHCVTRGWSTSRRTLANILNTALLVLSATSFSSQAETSSDRTSHGDWILQCKDNTQECTMSQVAIMQDSRKPLMQVDLLLGNPDERKLVFILPLGTALDLPPKLYLENTLISELEIKFCLTEGCYYSQPLSDALLEQFLSMYRGKLVVRSHKEEPLNIPISGKGSRAAFNSFRERF